MVWPHCNLYVLGKILFQLFTKIYSFLKPCYSFYENNVCQLMSAGASLERLGERILFLKMFCLSHFRFWSLLAKKLQICYVIFVYILEGKIGKTEKTGKKIPKLK
jgi:hypothetical protein